MATRNHVEDLRGASRLAIEATKGVTGLVEAMHQTIAGGPAILGQPLAAPVRLMTGLVYGSIRGVTQAVGAGLDLALGQLAPLFGETRDWPDREAVLAAVNGVLGDYLDETKNPLAIPMRLRHAGQPIDRVQGKLLVLVHGSSMSDLGWTRLGHDHGAELARELGYTPVYLHYNSGLHVSLNGRAFSALLEEHAASVDELVLVGHSMGGLVSRSACHYGESAAWRKKLRALVCLGTPHHGAPLERGGNLIDRLLVLSRYSAPLAKLGHIRSAGVTDLRHGNVLDEDWLGHDRFTHHKDARSKVVLPDGVPSYAIAGTTTKEPGGKLAGDGLVPVDSALGRHRDPALTLAFTDSYIGYGMGHLDLLHRREVYEKVRSWLQ
jgi:pimeloyl-ACP methyl ester carboxylesterase